MIPILNVEETRELDRQAANDGKMSVLIERSGYGVYKGALDLLGGTYAKRVVAICGKGNNGNDARVAADLLARRGAKVVATDANAQIQIPPGTDLVIDGAFGTGFRGEYQSPTVPQFSQVLAVDIPSGVNGDTGVACVGATRADMTVCLGTLKPGLVFGDGPNKAGKVVVHDIGLRPGKFDKWLVEYNDCVKILPHRGRADHKWSYPVGILGASEGMEGASHLCALAALRSGAGMVRVVVTDNGPLRYPISEAVFDRFPIQGFVDEFVRATRRWKVAIVGPGLGLDHSGDLGGFKAQLVRAILKEVTIPVILDADALKVFGSPFELGELTRQNPVQNVVITPHEGEFQALVGRKPDSDRISEVVSLAKTTGATVLLKGPSTVVASPDGRAAVVTSGTSNLATAGTGDVLAGLIGALIAQGMSCFEATFCGAYIHGDSARGSSQGRLIASDLPHLIGTWFEKNCSTSN